SNGPFSCRSSRIFIRGLPPRYSDNELKKHFSQTSQITDCKYIPHRRIAYVGYKTVEEAQKAVDYFNRTFIRMSRINVEIARAVSYPYLYPSSTCFLANVNRLMTHSSHDHGVLIHQDQPRTRRNKKPKRRTRRPPLPTTSPT